MGEIYDIHYGDVLIKFDSIVDTNTESIPRINPEVDKTYKNYAKDGDIIMADTAEDETVGKVCELQNIGDKKIVSGLHTIWMRFKEGYFAPSYLGYYLNSSTFHKQLLPYMHGTKVTSISKEEIKNVDIYYPQNEDGSPDINKQEEIITVANSIVKQIKEKQILYNKKKQILEGIKEKVLSNPEWEKVRLGDYLKVETGISNTEDKVDYGQYPFFVRSSIVERSEIYNFDCEAVLTAGDGVGTGKVFHYVNGKFDAHQRVYIISGFKEIYGKFFYYYFSQYFFDEVSKYTAKTSVDSVRKSMITDMLIPYPEKNVQIKISEQLTNMDLDLIGIKKEIEKLYAIKEGLMQLFFSKLGDEDDLE